MCKIAYFLAKGTTHSCSSLFVFPQELFSSSVSAQQQIIHLLYLTTLCTILNGFDAVDVMVLQLTGVRPTTSL